VECRYKDHVMIFHRGVGVIRKKDLFITQKIDLLVKYLVAWPAKQVHARTEARCGACAACALQQCA
jgi:hypothetical protein